MPSRTQQPRSSAVSAAHLSVLRAKVHAQCQVGPADGDCTQHPQVGPLPLGEASAHRLPDLEVLPHQLTAQALCVTTLTSGRTQHFTPQLKVRLR